MRSLLPFPVRHPWFLKKVRNFENCGYFSKQTKLLFALLLLFVHSSSAQDYPAEYTSSLGFFYRLERCSLLFCCSWGAFGCSLWIFPTKCFCFVFWTTFIIWRFPFPVLSGLTRFVSQNHCLFTHACTCACAGIVHCACACACVHACRHAGMHSSPQLSTALRSSQQLLRSSQELFRTSSGLLSSPQQPSAALSSSQQLLRSSSGAPQQLHSSFSAGPSSSSHTTA